MPGLPVSHLPVQPGEGWWNMGRYGFHFDGTRCTGCHTCVLACKDYHDLSDHIAYRQVYEYGGGDWEQDEQGSWTSDVFLYFVSLACNHCESPACTQACPTGAMHKDELGFVSVDSARCIGCGYCALSCPYHAPKVDRTVGHSVKCDGCEERVVAGRLPVCVEACPLRALDFGPYDELLSRYGRGTDVAPLPASGWTNPSLLVTPSRHARPTDDTDGSLENLDQIV